MRKMLRFLSYIVLVIVFIGCGTKGNKKDVIQSGYWKVVNFSVKEDTSYSFPEVLTNCSYYHFRKGNSFSLVSHLQRISGTYIIDNDVIISKSKDLSSDKKCLNIIECTYKRLVLETIIDKQTYQYELMIYDSIPCYANRYMP